MSSWGWKGYNEYWLEGSNDWIYRHLHKAAERMVEIANENKGAYGLTERALKQCARELLMLQTSCWAFIMKTGTVVSYANKRTVEHTERFTKLYEMIKSGHIDEGYLADVEWKDNSFPNIDFRSYCS